MKTTGVKTNGATTTCRRGALAAILIFRVAIGVLAATAISSTPTNEAPRT